MSLTSLLNFPLSQVVTKGFHADLFAFVSSPLILTSFAALCEAGDRQKALRSAVGTRAFFGPWLGESPQQQRVRISIMQASTWQIRRIGNKISPKFIGH